MPIYNLTNLTNSTDFVGLIGNVNSLTGDLYAAGLMLSAFIVGYVVFNRNTEGMKALLASSFITSILGVLLWTIGWISLAYVLIVVTILSILMLVIVFGGD